MAIHRSMIKSATSETETPLMKQYNTFKAKYPDAVLLFRVGDFYETFGEDAKAAASILGIVLTKRANGKANEVELAGFPHHSLDTYLPKLVRAGRKVAICDQLEDPKMAKGIVKRGVTEMVTPGVITGDNILHTKTNNFLGSVYSVNEVFGVAFVDISTGEFLIAQGTSTYIEKLLQSFQPSELVFPKSKQKDYLERFGSAVPANRMEDWVYAAEHAQETLMRLFETNSLKGFGVEEETVAIVAAGAAIQYLKDTEHHQLSHITRLNKIAERQYVWLDRFTIRNLELINTPHAGGSALIDVLDETVSPMGARLLKRWLLMPLVELAQIHERQRAVEFFTKNHLLLEELQRLIRQMGDLERLISKVSLQKINPREMVQLKRGLILLPEILQQLNASGHDELKKLAAKIQLLPLVTDKIEQTLLPEAGPVVAKGNFIREGVHAELDELRLIQHSGKEYIAGIQQKEIQRTGISSLKVGFNNVFGYYLEVTHTHRDKVPVDWIRKQTLSNAERFITPELKEYEAKVLGAEEKILALEEMLFRELVLFVKDFTRQIQQNAQTVAAIDCLLSFASTAVRQQYCMPEVNDTLNIDIRQGRHPVIERQLGAGNQYIPNDVFLDDTTQQILMITGPNMSGKSAILRQTALICLMAQMGSFVPATSASIGLVDRVFTRVGASDNLSAGESTFMVEMNETASIMNNLTPRSLILLDEIGRGTATYDGISIAWSLAEFLHHYPVAHPRTLFATHYHELNELEAKYERIKNYHITTREVGNKVIFLRQLVPGGSEHSFGIHVARMAGMPRLIVDRATEVLHELESRRVSSDAQQAVKQLSTKNFQLNIFDVADPQLQQVASELEKLEVDALTPIEALMKLHEWKKRLKG